MMVEADLTARTQSPDPTYAQLVESGTARLRAADVDSPVVDSVLLMLHVLDTDRAGFATRARDLADIKSADVYDSLIVRRCLREPLQHIVGSAPFLDFEVLIDRRALIPRPETEILAVAAIRVLAALHTVAEPTAVDLCTGSGAVAIALARAVPSARIIATDVSADALALTRENIEAFHLTGRIEVSEGDLFGALDSDLRDSDLVGTVDLVVANPPYVTSSEISALSPEVRDHDPRIALDGGDDGLDIVRRILNGCARWLRPGGTCLVELGDGQYATAASLATQVGLAVAEPIADLAGRDRILEARTPATHTPETRTPNADTTTGPDLR